MEHILTGGLAWSPCGHEIDERDDLVTPLAVLVERIFARQLDRALVRLRAAIGKNTLPFRCVFSTSFLQPTIGSVVNRLETCIRVLNGGDRVMMIWLL